MAMNGLLTVPFALGMCSCVGPHTSSHDYGIYFGTVKDTSTGTTLSSFCTSVAVERSSVIVFSAAPGSVVEEEVLFEWRTEKYPGSVPPQRDEAFWCSGAPEVYDRLNELWNCLRSTDSDPPATILAIEQRGQLGDKGSSSGYALKLEVRHPGVLHLAFDSQCRADRSSSLSDATVSSPWAELTIQ
jgi:hypothetical protein